ncbi:MAG: MBL fold metallo-hydrolase [Actinomycetota bacterium]|nr:MBL fold metallo-hydrolase [Actinomycetota bacterium]
MPARFELLLSGSVRPGVTSSVSLVTDGASVVVVDPGMVHAKAEILAQLSARGVAPEQVTDVVVTHLHLDHTMNVGMFPNATVHDFMASYKDDVWTDHDKDRFRVAPNVYGITTPGHTREDISIVVVTEEGMVVCTHAWWSRTGPRLDPYSFDQEVLKDSRARVLAIGPSLIVPGHGTPFAPEELDLA